MTQQCRIAILLPAEPEYASRLLEGAISYAEECSEVVLVEMPFVRKLEGSPLPDGPLDFDGALVWLNVCDTWIERMISEDVVLVNVSGEWRDKNLPMVVFDGGAIEDLAFDHLAGLGRSQMAFICFELSDECEVRHRQRRFLDKAARRGLDVAAFQIGPVDGIENRTTSLPKNAADRLRRFLVGLPKPAAIWCEDDYLAHLVCDHALMDGLRVPEDVAVLGLGDFSVSRLGKPSISSVPLPGQIVGRRALKLIHQILAGEEPPSLHLKMLSPPVNVRESTGGVVDERFQKIHQWIHDHACEGLTVNDLVRTLPMSHVSFTKHFARIFHCTPGEEIRRVKTERAKHCLLSTDFSVERIADLCGFEQPGKFSKFFKRQTGSTPSAYRESMQGVSLRRKNSKT